MVGSGAPGGGGSLKYFTPNIDIPALFDPKEFDFSQKSINVHSRKPLICASAIVGVSFLATCSQNNSWPSASRQEMIFSVLVQCDAVPFVIIQKTSSKSDFGLLLWAWP